MIGLVGTQWSDLDLPSAVECAATNGIEPFESNLKGMEFFVPLHVEFSPPSSLFYLGCLSIKI